MTAAKKTSASASRREDRAAPALNLEQASQVGANSSSAAEVDNSEKPAPIAARKTMPGIPTGLVGRSAQAAIVRINSTARLAHPRHPDLGTLITDVTRQPVKNLHPAVAQYKAECLEYLRGLQEAQKAAQA